MTSGLLTLTVSPLRRVLSTIAAVNRPSMVSRDPAGIDDRATR